MNETTKIPLAVDIDRVLEVLAAQIYQSPLALLRENLQNAFDAVLLRLSKDTDYEPIIEVDLSSQRIVIKDNGIGMSRSDIEQHFWRAGSSSKNTPEAKAAGVVGTFGIGAMANFGTAKSLIVESEDLSGESRTWSSARRDTLSATENCITVESRTSTGNAGTTITVDMYAEKPLNVAEGIKYLKDCVGLIDVPVKVNGELISQNVVELQSPTSPQWVFNDRLQLTPDIVGDVEVKGDGTGEVWIQIDNIRMDDTPVHGLLSLRSGANTINTYRSGFSLAPTAVSSVYQFGGIANLGFLKPTAGREALESQSQQLLQTLIQSLDDIVSNEFANYDECDQSTKFMQWVLNHRAFDKCGRITARFEPDQIVKLGELSGKAVSVYVGHDPQIIQQSASPDARLIVLAQTNPRRKCQHQYLHQFCTVTQLDDSPKLKKKIDANDYDIAHSSIIFRIASVLESDYFLPVDVSLGEFSHPVPVLFDDTTTPLSVYISPSSSSIKTLAELYRSEYEVFGHMVKDFVRTSIFPKVANHVPSATREGAEAFLRRMRSKIEVFEYEMEDTTNLSDIWDDVLSGRITVDEGARRSQVLARRNVQIVGSPQRATEIIPDLDQVAAETPTELGMAAPAISRTDIETDAKLLIIPDDEPDIAGFRCFIALTDRIFEEKGDFFLEPHATDIIWGGQRALFVFEHHSGEFGLYYDIQAPNLVAPDSGGGPRNTATLFLKNKVFIPIPNEIKDSFIPIGEERKRLEVRCDVLYTKGSKQGSVA